MGTFDVCTMDSIKQDLNQVLNLGMSSTSRFTLVQPSELTPLIIMNECEEIQDTCAVANKKRNRILEPAKETRTCKD